MPLHLTMRRHSRSIAGTMRERQREHRHAIGAERSINQGDGSCDGEW